MLIAEMNYHKGVFAQAYKFALEICMDRMDYKEVSQVELPPKYRSETCKRPKGFKDVSMRLIRETLGLNDIEDRDVPIMALFAFLQKEMKIEDSPNAYGKHRLNDLRITFINYIANNSQYELISQYAKTEMVRKMIINQLSKNPTIGKQKALLHGNLVFDFYKDYLISNGNEKRFDIESSSVLAYITYHYSRFFSRTYAKEIRNLVDTKDLSLTVGDDKEEVSIIDTIPYERPREVHLENFTSIAYNILSASSIIYSHNNEIFYDLWSRYKFQVTRDRYQVLINNLNREFPLLRASRYINCVDSNYENTTNNAYRNGIRNAKEDVLAVFEREFNGGLTQSKYESVFIKMCREDERHQNRNGHRLFTAEGTKRSQTPYSNNDIFLKILTGFSSVRALANYCSEAKIDPLSVPSDIFKSMPKFARVPSFEEYMATSKVTSRLIDEAYGGKYVDGLDSNDDIIKSTLGTEDYNLKALAKLKFSTIREILFDTGKTFSSERSLNRESDFQQPLFIDACNQLGKIFYPAFLAYYNMSKSLNLLSERGIKLCETVERTLTLDINGTTKSFTFYIPVRWLDVPESTLKELSGIKLLADINKPLADKFNGNPQGFYNMFRMVNLRFVICCRLYSLLRQLTMPGTGPVRVISILAQNKEVIDLPRKLVDIATIQRFIEKSISGVSKDNVYYPILDVSLCFAPGIQRLTSELNFKAIYNITIKPYCDIIENIRRIRDELDTDLQSNGVMVKSPFGNYHNVLMNESKVLGVGVISDMGAASNKQFKLYLNNRDKDYKFLVVGGRAAYVMRDNLKYYVHISGKLFCPSASPETIKRINLLETDVIRFE